MPFVSDLVFFYAVTSKNSPKASLHRLLEKSYVTQQYRETAAAKSEILLNIPLKRSEH